MGGKSKKKIKLKDQKNIGDKSGKKIGKNRGEKTDKNSTHFIGIYYAMSVLSEFLGCSDLSILDFSYLKTHLGKV